MSPPGRFGSGRVGREGGGFDLDPRPAGRKCPRRPRESLWPFSVPARSVSPEKKSLDRHFLITVELFVGMNKDAKTLRQTLIRDIISRREFSDQEQILQAMKMKGTHTTQATLSRDLQEMGFVKVRLRPGFFRYELLDRTARHSLWERLEVLFDNFVTSMRGTNNLILIKTSPGNANGVASLIDSLNKPEILGTVAGDDTILVVLENESGRKRLETEFSVLLRRP